MNKYSTGIDEDMDLSLKLMGMKTSLVGNFQIDVDKYVLSLEAKLCEELMMTCLPSIEIVTGIMFPSVKPIGKIKLFARQLLCVVTYKTIRAN